MPAGCTVAHQLSLEESGISRFVNYFTEKTFYQYRSGQVVFREHEKASGVFCLLKGMAKVSRISGGKSVTLLLTMPGQLLGLDTCMNQASFSFSLTTMEPCTFCVVSKSQLLSAIKKDHAFAIMVMKLLREEINRLENEFERLHQQPVATRVAAIIYRLNEWFGNDGTGAIDLNLNLEEIASLVRITESNLGKVLDEFKRRRYLVMPDNKIIVINQDALKRESGFNT